jgi:DNA-binding response OmpR family regulator
MARILLIDDDDDVRTLLVYELEAAGHDVRVARDGMQGLVMQRAAPAELVITDIFMPEKEGIETIRELKEEFPRTKVIAISGGGRLLASPGRFTMHDLGVVARHLGAAAVLSKPFEIAQLLKSIEAALDGR